MIKYKRLLLICFLVIPFLIVFGQSIDYAPISKKSKDSLIERYSINGELNYNKINDELDNIYKLLNSDEPYKRNIGKVALELRSSVNPYLKSLEGKNNNVQNQVGRNDEVKHQVGYNNMVRYQEGQEEFAGGVFGFDPYKTVQENREYYARMGYTMSYKYRDSDLYKYFGISAAILLLIVVVISRQKNFQNVTNNPK